MQTITRRAIMTAGAALTAAAPVQASASATDGYTHRFVSRDGVRIHVAAPQRHSSSRDAAGCS